MKVKVIAPFALTGADREGCLQMPAGSRVRDLLQHAGAARLYGRVLPVLVNGKQVDQAHVLVDGDIVVFVAPMSGG